MCGHDILQWLRENIIEDEIRDKNVLDIGSLLNSESEKFDIDSSVRANITPLSPASYIGVDIFEGAGVDIVCDGKSLLEKFGNESFDVVICTEVLEHVLDWRGLISTIKKILKSEGLLIFSVPSRGKPYHAYPHDYWRFEEEDLRNIFSDLNIIDLRKKTGAPGVMMKARKPLAFKNISLQEISIYSIITHKRTINRSEDEKIPFHLRAIHSMKKNGAMYFVPSPVRRVIKQLLA